jgi:malate dehydrogenase
MRPKIAVIGAGNVGATCAQRLAERELGDVSLVDVVEGVPQGKGLDLAESAPVERFDVRIGGESDPSAIAGADLVIVTAGKPRTPGMTREDLLLMNARIIQSVAHSIKTYAPRATVMMVTNPLDVMCWLARAVTGFPAARVLGMAGVLDSARFRAFLAMETGLSVRDIQTMVLGGHGDAMVPLVRYSTVSGIPVEQFVSAERLAAIVQRTRDGGAEIVNLLKTGGAYYAPASGVAEMSAAILRDQKRLLPCSAYLDGAYGLRDVYVGVPAVLGAAGVERIVELPLLEDELAALRASAAVVAQNIQVLKANGCA